jgi:hypothetical protein
VPMICLWRESRRSHTAPIDFCVLRNATRRRTVGQYHQSLGVSYSDGRRAKQGDPIFSELPATSTQLLTIYNATAR